ncbi:MAG TPA: hypothetical protein VFS39_03130 [Nitrospira sp.]|nr:hypothetical protein [Nitrospira sp.]
MVSSIRPVSLAAIACAAVLVSWGIEVLVLASSGGASSVPASLGPSPAASPAREPRMGAERAPSATPARPQERPPAPSASNEREEPIAEGPALGVPRELLAMLDLRKRDLDHREEALKQAEQRLAGLKAELEQVLTKIEAVEKRRKEAKDKIDKAALEQKAKQERDAIELRNQHQAQLAKMFETMPSEEAASRVEKMPDRKAIEVLRLVKGKTAGGILAAMKAERAARLTEQLLVTP